jgi:hypothetical protein
MNWIGEIIGGLRGIVAVLRFDAEAPKRFANTPDGVRRSFVAAAAALPIYLMVLQASLAAMTPRPGLMRYLPMMLLFYAIEWLIWPNLMVGIAVGWGGSFYCRYVVAYNGRPGADDSDAALSDGGTVLSRRVLVRHRPGRPGGYPGVFRLRMVHRPPCPGNRPPRRVRRGVVEPSRRAGDDAGEDLSHGDVIRPSENQTGGSLRSRRFVLDRAVLT